MTPEHTLLVELAQVKASLRRERRRTQKARAGREKYKQEAQDWKWQALTLARRQRSRVGGNALIEEAA